MDVFVRFLWSAFQPWSLSSCRCSFYPWTTNANLSNNLAKLEAIALKNPFEVLVVDKGSVNSDLSLINQ